MGIIKNMDAERILNLKDEIHVMKGQVVSKTLVQNKAMNMTLFAFDKDEEISSHKSDGDAFVQVLEGRGKYTVDGKEYILEAGDSLIMPAGKPHAIYSVEAFKWLLTVVF